LTIGGKPARKISLSLGLARHEPADEARHFAATAVPCHIQPLFQIGCEDAKGIHRSFRPAIAEEVLVAVRDNHKISGA
jgi:hypothetical protein